MNPIKLAIGLLAGQTLRSKSRTLQPSSNILNFVFLHIRIYNIYVSKCRKDSICSWKRNVRFVYWIHVLIRAYSHQHVGKRFDIIVKCQKSHRLCGNLKIMGDNS